MWTDLIKLTPLVIFGKKRSAAAVYDLLSTRYRLGDNSLYMNLGYWDGARTYDEAAQALTDELGKVAGLAPGQRIVDVGFSFGDQDMRWTQKFGVDIVGLNISREHVEHARRRVEERGLAGRIDLRFGTATAMPLPNSACDRVLALECAFHFVTRADFFAEAFRVLVPGGRLALTDLIRRGTSLSMLSRLYAEIAMSLFQAPAENFYSWDVYQQHLRSAGFENIQMRSVREQVLPPFRKYLRKRLDDEAATRGMNPLLRRSIRWCMRAETPIDPYDYILVTADKPVK